MKAHAEWKVLPHDPVQQLSRAVWRVEGALPGMALRRVMTLVQLENRDLAIHNGIAVDDATRAQVEAWGRPRWLLVPNGYHRLDAPAYKARYPQLEVLCPEGSRAKVAQVLAVDGTYADFPGSTRVRLETLDGTGAQEGVVIVRDPEGSTLIFNDAVFNQPHLPGTFGTLYRWLGQSGGPRITALARMFLIKDKRAFAQHLLRLADEPNLRRIVVSHLLPIEQRPADVLRELAQPLLS